MDKGKRNELTRLNFKRRLKNLRLLGKEGNFFAYKSHGAPCSCSICSHSKYNRVDFKTRTKEELEADRSSAYDYLA